MRNVLLVCLLLAGPVLAKPEVRFTADDWRIEGTTLHFRLDLPESDWNALPIDVAGLARRLEIKVEAVPAYLKGLDSRLPILVEPGYKTGVLGIWSLTEERLRKELRLELSPTLGVKLVNAGKVVLRVVKPNDGSESGWREPEIYFEREVDGKWVRGAKPGRCGLYARDWQNDIVYLNPGEALALEGYLPVDMSFGLARPFKAKVRAVYVYRGGLGSKGGDAKPEPGPMGKMPPFTLFSEPVEIDLK
jgi:hypothetical protein